MQLLRSVGDTLTVLVCDGFDTSAATPEVSAPPAGARPRGLRPAPSVAGRVLVRRGQDTLDRCESDLGEPCGAGARSSFQPRSQPWWDRLCTEGLVVSSKKRLNRASSICALGPPGQGRTAQSGTQPACKPPGPATLAWCRPAFWQPLSRELRAQTCVPAQTPGRACGDPVVLRCSPWRKCQLPGPGPGCRGLVSSPARVLHQPGCALLGGPAVLCCRCPRASSISPGGPLLLQQPPPPPPGAPSPQRLPAP